MAVPLPGKYLSCASLGFSCVPSPASTATIATPTAATATGRRSTNRAHRPQAPSSGCPWSWNRFGTTRTLFTRWPSTASIAGSNVSVASTETTGISMPPMPIPRSNGRVKTIIESSHRNGRTRDDHRVAGMRHRLHQRRIDVVAFAQLVAEPEDHQQRVVDCNAKTNQRNQEQHDDRDVGDVGQKPNEREGVQDRRDGDHEWHQNCRQRSKDEEQDHERAETADQRLQKDTRPTARTGRGRFLQGCVPRP